MSYQGEFIKELVRRISVLEEEVGRLKGEPDFSVRGEPGVGKTFYWIDHNGTIREGCWANTDLQNSRLEFGNVFHTREEAGIKCGKIESVLKGEL